MHPLARIEAPTSQCELGAGVKISERTVLEVTDAGSITMGPGVWIAPDCGFHTATSQGIAIGADTSLQRGCLVQGSVTIGAGCLLAPNVFISSGSHRYDRWPHLPIREQERRAALDGTEPIDRPVRIGDDVWIGVHAVVMPGVTIGRGVIIGANAVVTHDVAPYVIVGGVPARPLGTRLDWSPPSVLDATVETAVPYLSSGFDLEFTDTLIARFGAAAELQLAPGRTVRVTCELHRAATVRVNRTTRQLPPGRHDVSAERIGAEPITLSAHDGVVDAPARLIAANSFGETALAETALDEPAAIDTAGAAPS